MWISVKVVVIDALKSAGRHWQMLHGDLHPQPPFSPLVVSRDGRPVRLDSGVLITPDASFGDCADASIVCITTIARYAGPQRPMQVARIQLMDPNTTSPVAYASLSTAVMHWTPWSGVARSGPH